MGVPRSSERIKLPISYKPSMFEICCIIQSSKVLHNNSDGSPEWDCCPLSIYLSVKSRRTRVTGCLTGTTCWRSYLEVCFSVIQACSTSMQQLPPAGRSKNIANQNVPPDVVSYVPLWVRAETFERFRSRRLHFVINVRVTTLNTTFFSRRFRASHL